MTEQRYYLGLKAIIQNAQGQILLLKHTKGYWDFPGGRIQQGGGSARDTFARSGGRNRHHAFREYCARYHDVDTCAYCELWVDSVVSYVPGEGNARRAAQR